MIKEKSLRIYCDGGARGNPGPAAAATVIKNTAGNTRVICGKYLGETTNNKAEYAAVELSLEKVQEVFGTTEKIKFFLDSSLVVNQLSGLYRVKDAAIRETILRIRNLEIVAKEVYYQHIPREKNRQADKIVNKVLDERADFLQIVNG